MVLGQLYAQSVQTQCRTSFIRAVLFSVCLPSDRRLAKNIFCYGLDRLRSIVTDLDLKQNEILVSLQFLFCIKSCNI